MIGYRDGPMAVEFYKGSWILRCPMPGDLPLTESSAARAAMAAWRERNRERFKELTR